MGGPLGQNRTSRSAVCRLHRDSPKWVWGAPMSNRRCWPELGRTLPASLHACWSKSRLGGMSRRRKALPNCASRVHTPNRFAECVPGVHTQSACSESMREVLAWNVCAWGPRSEYVTGKCSDPSPALLPHGSPSGRSIFGLLEHRGGRRLRGVRPAVACMALAEQSLHSDHSVCMSESP